MHTEAQKAGLTARWTQEILSEMEISEGQRSGVLKGTGMCHLCRVIPGKPDQGRFILGNIYNNVFTLSLLFTMLLGVHLESSVKSGDLCLPFAGKQATIMLYAIKHSVLYAYH